MYHNYQELVDSFKIRGNKAFSYMFDGEKFAIVSYSELYTRILSTAAYFQGKELKKGDKVGLISENRPEWAGTYLGIVYNGIIAVPIDAMLNGPEVLTLVKDAELTQLCTSISIFKKLKQETPEILEIIKEWIIFDKDESLKEYNNIMFVEDLYTENPIITKTGLEDSDLASLIYTSGTTGAPKAVMLSNGNFMHQINNLVNSAELTENDIILSVLPLHHTFEFSVEMTMLGVGGALTYAESLKPNRLIEAIKSTNVTLLIGIPTLYAKILDGIERNLKQLKGFAKILINILYGISALSFKITGNHKCGEKLFKFLRKKAGFGHVRFMISGAAPLAYSTAKGYAVLGFNLGNGYGLTESSPVISVNPPRGPIDNKSVGVAVKGVEWKILDADDTGIGEICVKGDNVMQGYYKNPEATAQVLTEDNWLKTGDMGCIKVHQGREYLYITGRSKNIIVTGGGKNVYPEEIEEKLISHPYILENIVIGVPISDEDLSEVVCALIVIDPLVLEAESLTIESDIVKKAINQHVREVNDTLQSYQKIRNYEIRSEELVKNSTRKIKRFEYKGKKFRHLIK